MDVLQLSIQIEHLILTCGFGHLSEILNSREGPVKNIKILLISALVILLEDGHNNLLIELK